MPRPPSAFVLATLGCLAVAACASQPREGLAQAKPVSSYDVGALATAPAGPWPGAQWWRAYKDPQLDALIDQALADSPDVAVADARVRRAGALAGQARAALFPAVTANASAAEAKQSYNNGIPAMFVPRGYNDIGRATLDASYEIDFWGKNRAAVAAAASELRATQADRASAALILSTSVATAYGQLAQLFADRAIAQDAVALRQHTADLVAQRVTGGLDTRAEARQAEANTPAARGELSAIDESIALTRDQLAALVGAGPGRGLTIVAPATAALPAFGLPPRLAADLIGRKPEIVAARWRATAAERRIGVAKAQFYPNVNLVAFIGLQALGLDSLTRSGSDIGQVGPAVSLPIFEGGRLRANLRGANADYGLAVAQYDAAVTHALRDAADAAASAAALSDRLTLARAALAADEDAYHVARLRYGGGLANYQSVLAVEDSVLLRRRALADLQARAFILDVALVRALGGGFTDAAADTPSSNARTF